MKFMYLFIAIAIGALALLILTCRVLYRLIFLYPKKNSDPLRGFDGEISGAKKIRRELIEGLVTIPYDELSVKGYKNDTIFARYYRKSDTAPTAILLHGYKSMGVIDFSGIFDELSSLGYNLLIADSRAHGKSGGKAITYGIFESYDVKSLAEYVAERSPESKIVLYGMSMGGAAVLTASALELPQNVVGIIADCPFSSPEKIIRKALSDRNIPASVFYPLARLGARLFGGFDPSSSSAEDAVSKTDLPILLIHGGEDRLVPFSMSEDIAKNAKSDVTLINVPKATHTTSVIYGKELYSRALYDFTRKVMTKKGQSYES